MMESAGLRIRVIALGAAAVTLALSADVNAEGVRWMKDPQAAMQQAQATGRPVLMKFTADWCGFCKKMERTTFSDVETAEVVHRDFVPLLIDADQHKELTRQLKIKGLPATLIVAPDTTILERITGYQTSAKLLPRLHAVTAARETTPRVPALPAAQQTTTIVETQTPAIEQNPFAQQEATPAPGSIATTVPQQSAMVVASTPAAQPEVAFGGLCLTSVVDERQLVPGADRFAAEYRGRLLYFRDAGQRDLFFQDPGKYWPVLDGSCASTFLESGRLVPGMLQHAAVFRDQIWLFKDRSGMLKFIDSPADHAAAIEERQKLSKTAVQSY